MQISTCRQVFETIRASEKNILQDAIYGPESNLIPHLFFHWQQRQEQEAQDRFGHFSFLTPAVKGKGKTDVSVPRSVSRVEVKDAAQDLSVCTEGTQCVLGTIDR